MLTRDDAFKLIANHIENGCVPREIVQQVLGDKKYKLLLNDKLRNNGWTSDNVYYWNVVDYVCMPDPPDEEKSNNVQLAPMTLKDVLLLLDDLIEAVNPSDSEKLREEIRKRLNEIGA